MIAAIYARKIAPWLVGLAVLFGGAAAGGRLGHRIGLTYGDGILLASGLILLWYTIETRNMRLQMARQNEMAVWPLLVTAIEVDQRSLDRAYSSGRPYLSALVTEHLFIRNVGRGPALSIRIDDVIIEQLSITFDTVDVLAAGAVEMTMATVYVEGDKADDKSSAFVPSLKATSDQTYRLMVRYRDVTGQPHFSLMQMGKSGTRLLQHSGVEV